MASYAPFSLSLPPPRPSTLSDATLSRHRPKSLTDAVKVKGEGRRVPAEVGIQPPGALCTNTAYPLKHFAYPSLTCLSLTGGFTGTSSDVTVPLSERMILTLGGATPPALSYAIEAHCQQSAPGLGGVAAPSGTAMTEVVGSGIPANQRRAAPCFLSRMASIPQQSKQG
ncbi:unnamed protein product [Pleuronectes platessa]|uniref:Uncharacterized protein n=1 Tax=Pleuronectes platessa TaxID=8262 RepID=A0A9N7U630_PLEPL|nr:unnamed protein product [Pleuronectes platessa]